MDPSTPSPAPALGPSAPSPASSPKNHDSPPAPPVAPASSWSPTPIEVLLHFFILFPSSQSFHATFLSLLSPSLSSAPLFRDCEAFGAGDRPPPASLGRQRRPVCITYQGFLGSYCQEAAPDAYPSSNLPPFLPCPHMEATFSALFLPSSAFSPAPTWRPSLLLYTSSYSISSALYSRVGPLQNSPSRRSLLC